MAHTPLKQPIDIEQMPGNLLRRCQQIAVALFLDECNAYDLTPLQFAVLSTLASRGAQDQVTLGGATALGRTTITVVVRKLEERGLLGRDKSARDQRSKIVSITAAGLELVQAVLPAVGVVQQRILAPLSEAESAQFLALLAKLADANNSYSRAPIKRQKGQPTALRAVPVKP